MNLSLLAAHKCFIKVFSTVCVSAGGGRWIQGVSVSASES